MSHKNQKNHFQKFCLSKIKVENRYCYKRKKIPIELHMCKLKRLKIIQKSDVITFLQLFQFFRKPHFNPKLLNINIFFNLLSIALWRAIVLKAQGTNHSNCKIINRNTRITNICFLFGFSDVRRVVSGVIPPLNCYEDY